MLAMRTGIWKDSWKRGGILAAVLLFVLGANVVVTHRVLTAPYPGHNDFMSRWEGARSYWRDGLDPYGDRASANIQQRIYGRMATPEEDPGYFAYPFYTVFLLWPLVFVPYAWASAIWMVVLEVCLIVALLLLLDLYRWRPQPWLWATLLFWAIVNYYAARGLFLGQPGLLVYLCQVVALWGLARRRDRLAGGALALSTIKPQMGFLLVPFLLLLGLTLKRWRFVGAFLAIFGVLMGMSFALLPSWLREWLEQVRLYPSYTAIGAPTWIVIDYYLGLGKVGEWGVTALLWVFLGWAWYRVLWQKRMDWLGWTVMLTLTVTHLSAVRTATPHFVVFTIPLVFLLKQLAQRGRRGRRWIALILAGSFILPWVHFVLTVEGRFEHPTIYLPVPFAMLIVLWLTRRLWWQTPSVLVSERAV